MFETLTAAPPDAILGLTEAFKTDPNPNKINLGVGVYKDAQGITSILPSVKQAEDRMLTNEQTKTYLPIDGLPAYSAAVQEILFGLAHEIVVNERAVTAQTPGGTGALRVAADFIAQSMPNATIWLSEPTWPNHPNVFGAAGLSIATYPYFDSATNGLAFNKMLETIRTIPAGDVLVLHGCCHNPTGVDLSPAEWQLVADATADRQILPLVDFAYQGFANGLSEDAAGLLTLCQSGTELLISSSFSKNFGLYNERTGALTLVTGDKNTAQITLSHIKRCIRANYSNPPSHGANIVKTVLTDANLRKIWEGEVTEMRDRINTMRHLFVETLNEKSVDRDVSFIAKQRGMFSFSGLTPEQVQTLRERHAVYVVSSGRINVAGMTEDNMDYLCTAIADVL